MTTSEIKEKITAFISRFIKVNQLPEDQDIFALGFVNSMFAMQLVLFVEQEFGIRVENEDLDIQNFNTVKAITALVENKRAALETV